MKSQIDWLSISFPKKSNVDLEKISKDLFGTIVEEKQGFDFRYFRDIRGLTVVEYWSHMQIQLSGEFWLRKKAFLEAQALFEAVSSTTKAKISRVDIMVDIVGEDVEDVLPKQFVDKAYFPSAKDSVKPCLIGSPVETITFLSRHKKVRIYNKIKQIQNLIQKGYVRPHQIELIRKYGDTYLTRVEFELRSHFADFADSIFQHASSEDLFAQAVLDQYLKRNLMVDKNDPLWIRLRSNQIIDWRRERRPKRIEDREVEIKKTMSYLRNKFLKWGYTNFEAATFVYRAFGYEGVATYMDLEVGLTYGELVGVLLEYERLYGRLPSRAAGGSDEERVPA